MNYSFLEKLGDPISGNGKSMLDKIKELRENPDGIKEMMKTEAKNAGAALEQAALNRVDTLVGQGLNAINGRLNRLLLGNVFGFSPAAFLADPAGQTINALQSGVVNAFTPKEKAPNALGNTYKT
jgi:hypothetical protein